jgi:hypothetical protein
MELLQSQLNGKLANAEREARQHQFLVSVCKLFNSDFDRQGAATFSTVGVILRKVREDLDPQQSLRRATNLLDEVKQLLNSEHDRDVIRDGGELVRFD